MKQSRKNSDVGASFGIVERGEKVRTESILHYGFRISVVMFCLMAFFAQLALAGRDDALVRDFEIDGVSKRLYVEVRNFPDIADATIEQWKHKLADWAEHSWRQYEGHGFKSPANDRDADGAEVLRLFYEQAEGVAGNAGASGPLRIAGGPLGMPDGDLAVQSTVAHEIFHSVQFRYSDITGRYRNTFTEGTAQLAPSLINPDVNQLVSTTYSCESIYLDHPGGRMWFRPGGDNKDNVCATSLWWKYLSQQFSGLDPASHEHGIDTLKRLLDHLESTTGWRQRNIDEVAAVGDFNGNDLDDLLVTSDRYLGIVSPVFFNPTTLGVVFDGGRFGGAWRYQPTDKVVASCDVVGAKDAEFILQSSTHLGIIGLEDGAFETVASIGYGNRLGERGWKLNAEDRVLGADDFDGDGKCELLIKSQSHLGLVEHNGRSFETLSARQFGQRLDGGWVLSPGDHAVGSGDFDGDGRADFVLRSRSHVGLVTFDPAEGELRTLGSKLLSETSQSFDVMRFRPSMPDRLVSTEPSALKVLALSSSGGIDETASLPRSPGSSLDALADMNGDGRDELILKALDGRLTVVSADPATDSFPVLASVRPGTELNDGFNGNQFRNKWAPNRDYRIFTSGDFDGDGREEILVRDLDRVFVVNLDPGANFTIGEMVVDNRRFDSLVGKLDTFIRRESGGTRTLRSMFIDFAVANYLNALEGDSVTNRYRYSDELRYPGAIDFDTNPSTPPVRFTFDGGVGEVIPVRQEPWTSLYFRFTAPGSTIDVASQTRLDVDNIAYTLLTVEGDRLISKTHELGDRINDTLVLDADQSAILIVTSFEAPLVYEVSADDR